MHALISVSDKTGIVELASALHGLGIVLLSTGGTAKLLVDAGLPVTEVATHTGFPEMLDGRVKTLHPTIHGGLLARHDRADHMAALAAHGIAPIGLLVVNLYPFEATVANPECTLDDAIENIDIGGPAMVRSAAKNWRDVAVLTDASQYAGVLDELKRHGAVTDSTRFALAVAAFNRISNYDAAISDYLSSIDTHGEGAAASLADGQRAPERIEFPAQKNARFVKLQDLRYGENPHQRAAFYRDLDPAPGSLVSAVQLQGKALSYNNIADADAAWECVKTFGAFDAAAGSRVDASPSTDASPGTDASPSADTSSRANAESSAALASPAACVIVKHANPCGVAVGVDAAEAYAKALSTDPTSAFGGIIAFNVEVDEATAKRVAKQFVEVLLAPSYSAAALAIFAAKANTRVLRIAWPQGPRTTRVSSAGSGSNAGSPPAATAPTRAVSHDFKRVGSGLLIQTADLRELALSDLKVVTTRQPTPDQLRDLMFAWKVAKFVKSNAIVFCGNGMTLGVGAGQMSRLDSARIASIKAGHAGLSLAGSAVASDAFFPFRDGLDAVIDAGASSVIQPGGSVRDDEVVAAANERDIAMVLTGVRHFRH